MLTERVQTIQAMSRETYGAPRIHAELRDEGVSIGCKRVARLMQAVGLQGVSRRKGTQTTKRSTRERPAPDLVQRDFTAQAPNQLWVADITFVPTWAGFLYLSVVLDAFSRRIVGWSMANHMRSSLVLAALEMALAQHNPKGVIHQQTHTVVQVSPIAAHHARPSMSGAFSRTDVKDAFLVAMIDWQGNYIPYPVRAPFRFSPGAGNGRPLPHFSQPPT